MGWRFPSRPWARSRRSARTSSTSPGNLPAFLPRSNATESEEEAKYILTVTTSANSSLYVFNQELGGQCLQITLDTFSRRIKVIYYTQFINADGNLTEASQVLCPRVRWQCPIWNQASNLIVLSTVPSSLPTKPHGRKNRLQPQPEQTLPDVSEQRARIMSVNLQESGNATLRFHIGNFITLKSDGCVFFLRASEL